MVVAKNCLGHISNTASKMIISKELIDASINSKNAAQAAHEKAMREAIESMVDKVNNLAPIIGDIMDTFHYLKTQDKAMSSQLWSIICSEDEPLGLDFCNAILDQPGGKCGVRPRYSRKGCFGNIYVTEIGVYCGPSYKELYPLSELKRLEPKDYESMLNAMCLLVEAVPAYRDIVEQKLKTILEGTKYPQSALGKVQPE